MNIQGKIIAVLPMRSGTSSRGEWKSQSYVIETAERFPKKMVFDVFGADKIAQFAICQNEEVSVDFDIDAHEWNGRWFNSIRAFDVTRTKDATQAAINHAQRLLGAEVVQTTAQQSYAPQGDNYDLPF